MNITIIEGRIGQSELKYTPSGIALIEFSVAVSESYKDKQDKWKKHTEWFQCKWWGKQAEINADYLSKGKSVLVNGKQRTENWETTNGEKKSRKIILCSTVKHFSPYAGSRKIGDSSNEKNEQEGVSLPSYAGEEIPL